MLTPSPLETEAVALTDYEAKVVHGTYRVMARVGSQQLSLRQVAKELDVSAALLVYHFGTKDNLLLATMRWALVGIVERIKARLEDIDDPEAALEALVDELFWDPEANRDFYLVYLDLVQYAVRQPSFSELGDMLWKYLNGSYAVVIQHGVASGAFAIEDVERAAREARGIVEGAVVQWLQDEDWRATHARVRDDCLASLLVHLRQAPDA
jgi:AcrR family transcriptional regulator